MDSENTEIGSQKQQYRSANPCPEADEINLIDVLLVLLKYKKMILVACMVTFIGMCGITLLMPNEYTANARILPPQETKGGLSAALGGMSDLAALAGVSVGSSTSELYVGMLKSRAVADPIIDEFKLMEVYKTKSRMGTYSAFKDHVEITRGKDDSIISINVGDKDPKRSAAIANRLVDELKKLNVRLNLNTAGRERVFLETRLAMAKQELASAEENLKAFQEANKAIRIDDQANAIINAIAALRAEITSKEVELGVLLSFQTDQNPQVKALKEAILQLKKQMKRLEENSSEKLQTEDIFIATSQVPELSLQYVRLLREFKIQEAIFELLTKQYEMAKLNEARDTSTIQILDAAVIPDRKSKPNRSTMVILATFVMGFISVFIAFIREFTGKIAEEDPVRWGKIKTAISFRKNPK